MYVQPDVFFFSVLWCKGARLCCSVPCEPKSGVRNSTPTHHPLFSLGQSDCFLIVSTLSRLVAGVPNLFFFGFSPPQAKVMEKNPFFKITSVLRFVCHCQRNLAQVPKGRGAKGQAGDEGRGLASQGRCGWRGSGALVDPATLKVIRGGQGTFHAEVK